MVPGSSPRAVVQCGCSVFDGRTMQRSGGGMSGAAGRTPAHPALLRLEYRTHHASTNLRDGPATRDATPRRAVSRRAASDSASPVVC